MRPFFLASALGSLILVSSDAWAADIRPDFLQRQSSKSVTRVSDVQCFTGWWRVHGKNGFRPRWGTLCRKG
jgi:hypothetical protein